MPKLKHAQTLIEILVAIGLTAVILPGLLTGFVASREGKAQEANRLKAVALLREAEEAVRSAREGSWSNVSTNGTYYPTIASNAWSLTSGSESIDNFTRSIVIADVQRDSGGAIVASGGTVDPSTKSAVSTVSWTSPTSSSVSSTNYLHRYLSNAAWTQTTQAEFDGGTLTDTVTTNNSGGEVELATGTSGGDWASPALEGSYDNSGNDDANDIFVSGNYAYLATDNDSNSFVIIDISNKSSPTLTGTFNAGTDVNGVFVSGNYAYLATDSDAQELMVVDISNKSSPSLAGSLNLATKENATDVYVSGNYAYVTKEAGGGSDRELYIIDISSPTSPSETGSFEIGSDANGMIISGNYAYIATDDNSKELLIIDVSSPSSPSETGSYNASSNSNGEAVFISGNTAYLVTANNGSGSEFYVVNISSPSSPSLTGSYNVGGASHDVYYSGTNAFVANGINNKEFLVLDLSSPSSPSELGSFDLDGNGYGVFVSGDFAYLATGNNSQELIILEGGSGGGAYATSGTIESSSFDAGAEVAFNYLTFSITEPSGTNIVFELAINNDNSTWSYFGSYESAATVPLASINGRYIRYRATLSGDGSATPVLSDVSLNYSP